MLVVPHLLLHHVLLVLYDLAVLADLTDLFELLLLQLLKFLRFQLHRDLIIHPNLFQFDVQVL